MIVKMFDKGIWTDFKSEDMKFVNKFLLLEIDGKRILLCSTFQGHKLFEIAFEGLLIGEFSDYYVIGAGSISDADNISWTSVYFKISTPYDLQDEILEIFEKHISNID
jgi:hypothetical protein